MPSGLHESCLKSVFLATSCLLDSDDLQRQATNTVPVYATTKPFWLLDAGGHKSPKNMFLLLVMIRVVSFLS